MFRRQLVNEYGSGFGYEYFCSPVEGSEPVHVIVDHDDDSDPYGDVWNQTRVHG